MNDDDNAEMNSGNMENNNDTDSLSSKLDVVFKRLDVHEKAINDLGEQLITLIRSQPKESTGLTPLTPAGTLPTGGPPPPPPFSKSGEPINTNPPWFERFIAWIKEDWLLKLGALLLLIGFGWLASYAFLNNWIGPMGRIALGITAGVCILLLGWWRINKFIHQGGVFLVLGSTVMLLTIFAAREIYGFFTPLSALIIMFLSTAFVALASVKHNNRSLALASLLLAGLAPLLTNSPDPNFTALFAYLFVVTVGAIWIVTITGWRVLTAAALTLITLYSLPHFGYTSADTGTLLLFAYAFVGLFFITNTLGILKLKGKKIIPDLVTAAGSGLFLLVWIVTAAPDEWQSLIMAAWMIVFAAGAFMLFKITERREPFYVYLGVGIGLLAAATAAELNGAVLTIAYTIESGIIPLVAYYVLHDIRIVQKTSFLLIGPVLLAFGSISSSAWRSGVIHQDFFVLFVLASVFLLLGIFFMERGNETKDKRKSDFSAIMFVIASVYVYVLVWLSLHAALVSDDLATMFSLLVYTIAGLAAYTYGRMHDIKAIRVYGALLLGFVIGRLLLVEIWRMELSGRIITFFLIGTLLMSTAFFGKNKSKSTLIENESNN